ncbi:MAG: DivIVA domain-containing protein [Lachnospiraceae bacterium]|nr:DivIVA domain-containing protein [Lachnospiraceae bacterium]
MLTPIDIQNHVLKSTMGGYNKKETDDFLEAIRESYEQIYKENGDLKKKITTLSEGIQYYKQMEGTLQKTLVLAEQTASETLETSKTAAAQVEKESRAKAEVMLREAKSRADGLVADAQEKANKLTRESEERAATLKRDSEEKAAKLTRESEETAEKLTRESEEKASAVTKEAEEKAEKLTADAQNKADALAEKSQKKADALVAEAEKKADNIMHNANERADRIMADTKKSADEIIKDTRKKTEEKLEESGEQIAELTSIVKKLMGCYDDYKKQFKILLNDQLAKLEDTHDQIDTADLEALLESQHVKMAEEQAAAKKSVDDMEEHTKELDLPVEDTAPETEEPEEDILAGGLGADTAENEKPEEMTEPASLNIETPSGEKIGAAQGIYVAAEEAVAYMEPEDKEKEETPEDDIKSKLAEIDSIANEALKEMKSESAENPFSESNGMLGTSYDDFVPVKNDETEAAVSSEKPLDKSVDTKDTVTEVIKEEKKPEGKTQTDTENEIPPTTTDELPTVQETYDAETYVTNETYFGSADNMTYSIPDPVPAAAEAEQEIKAEPVEEAVQEKEHSIPMPDFGKLDAAEEAAASPEPVIPHAVPMPDFSKLDVKKSDDEPDVPDVSADLDAIAAEAMASLNKEESATTEEPTVQETYDTETYVTNETYFGSADNIPYTGSVARDAKSEKSETKEEDFSDGISGVDPTGNGLIPPAPGELFTAPDEFSNVPPADDEFAVTKPENPVEEKKADEEQSVTPFTFIDADK